MEGKAFEDWDGFSGNLKRVSDSSNALLFPCGAGLRCSWQDGDALPAHTHAVTLFSKARRLICVFGLHRCLLGASTFVPTCRNFSELSWKDQKDPFPEQQRLPPLQLCLLSQS